MRESAAQAVLLARAFEEADAEGVLLRADDRRDATERARAVGGDVEEQAALRAELLLATVEEEVPGLARARRLARIGPALAIPIGLIAFVLGLLSNALGPEKKVNILSFPLLGLLVWNVCVYAALLAAALTGRGHGARDRESGRSDPGRPRAPERGTRAPALGESGRTSDEGEERDAEVASSGAPSGAERVRGFAGGLASWLAELGFRRVQVRDRRLAGLVGRALAWFSRAWLRATSALTLSRLRFLLHVGAAMLAVGGVSGMYLRGLTSEYRATWESTFIGPDGVAALLGLVLGPAASLLGVDLPGAGDLARMRAPSSSGPAAIWIHLWALTAALVVVGPRLLLAAVELGRQWRLAANVRVSPTAGSFRALLAPDRGAGTWLEVLPYSLRLGRRQVEILHELMHDLFGLRAEVRVVPTIEYGADPSSFAGGESPACSIVVFPSVQSPEHEVHARFVEDMMAQSSGGQDARRVLVLVDGSAWRMRLGAARDDRRLAERRRAWDRVLREIGIAPVHVDLDDDVDAVLVEEAERRIWPGAGTDPRRPPATALRDRAAE